MALIFDSGLESGSAATEGITLIGATLATDRPRTGTYSLKTVGVDKYALRSITASSGVSYYARAYFNLDTLPGAGTRCQILEFFSLFLSASVVVCVNASGGIRVEGTGSFSDRDSAADLVAADTWYRLEARCLANSAAGSDDEIEVRLGGTTVLATEVAAWVASALGDVRFGNNYDYTGTAWFDDLAIDDATWPGPVGETPPQIILPDADIVTTGWAATPLHSKLADDSDASVITATLA